MKKLLILTLLCMATSVFSQSIEVGDYVIVNRNAKRWMTGERISSWVYLHPHLVSQVGSSFHSNGILLNVDGAYSWIKVEEVTKLTINKTEVTTDTVIVRDTIVSTQEIERVVYVHDTMFVSNEVEKQPVSIAEQPSNYHFQFYGDFNQYFGPKNYGAGIEAIFGVRMTEFAYLGGGVEFGYWMAGANAAKSMEFPVFVHTKVYLPIKHKYYPHVEMSLGANMGYRFFTPDESLRQSGFHYGVYAKGGIGIDLLKCLSLGVGYQYGGGFSNVSYDLHHAYLKIGFYLPK